MQLGNFIGVFLAGHVSGACAHHQKQWMMNYLISIPTDAYTKKIHIKTLKLLRYVSILRSSSWSYITQQSTGRTPVEGTLNNITLHKKTCCHNTLFIQRN